MDLANDKFDKDRFGLITGSACSVLFPDKGDGKAGMTTYAKKLANQKYFRFYDEVVTWQMQHGNLNEHEAFTFYQNRYDFSLEKGRFVKEGEFGGTSDAEAADYGVDFKCPTSLEGWLDYIHTGIDKQQENQAQMYLFLFKKESWKVCAYLTETEWMLERGLIYPVPEDKRMIIVEVKKKEGWEDRLIENSKFVIEERNKFYNILCEQFGEKGVAFIKEQEATTEPEKDYSKRLAEGKELQRKVNL